MGVIRPGIRPPDPADRIKAPPVWGKTLLYAVIHRLDAGQSSRQVAQRFDLDERAVERVAAQLRDAALGELKL